MNEDRKTEWLLEHRVRSRIVWENQSRLRELEDMLDQFFGVRPGPQGASNG